MWTRVQFGHEFGRGNFAPGSPSPKDRGPGVAAWVLPPSWSVTLTITFMFSTSSGLVMSCRMCERALPGSSYAGDDSGTSGAAAGRGPGCVAASLGSATPMISGFGRVQAQPDLTRVNASLAASVGSTRSAPARRRELVSLRAGYEEQRSKMAVST